MGTTESTEARREVEGEGKGEGEGEGEEQSPVDRPQLPPPPVEQKKQGKNVGSYRADFYQFCASTGTFLLVDSQVQVSINNTARSDELIECTLALIRLRK